MSFTPGSSNAQLTSTTYTDIVAAPAASTQRQVATVWIHNAGASAIDVTIAYDDNATVRILAVETLQANERFTLGSLVLDTTTRKLKGKLSGAGTVDVVSTWADKV